MNLSRLPALLASMLIAFQLAAAPVPKTPGVEAKAYILLDFQSGRVISAQEADARVEPASLTKMMTAYVVFEELKEGQIQLDDQVRVSEKAWRMPGSRMFIEVDKLVSVEDLLKGMIVQSGNDASVALAEHVAGSEEGFAQLMNRHGQRLGLSGSHFVNSTGLPHADHYTTARDMARLAVALVRDFPEHYAWHAQKKFTFNGITQYNRNKLLWQDESVDGVKTGHTETAGYCLVATAEREGMRLVSAVMGTDSEKARARESRKLLNYGFRFFETHRLYPPHEPLARVRVWKSDRETVEVGLAEELYVTVPRGQYGKLNAEMETGNRILAPIPRGQAVGTVRVGLEGEVLAERPLIALQSANEGSIWTQLVDHVKLMMQ